MKIFVSHLNTHQEATTAEEDLIHWGDEMTQSVDISHTLFPGIPELNMVKPFYLNTEAFFSFFG